MQLNNMSQSKLFVSLENICMAIVRIYGLLIKVYTMCVSFFFSTIQQGHNILQDCIRAKERFK